MKHNSVGPLTSIPSIRPILSVSAIILSLVFALAAFGVPVDTSWTYQGQLRRNGAGYTGVCNFQFSLWDAASAGTQQGSTQSINSVNVVNGLFTVTLDFPELFGGNQFFGQARWLGTSVQCSGDGGFTPLDPRQPITATPYALSLRPGATINADSGTGTWALRLTMSGPGSGSALSAVHLGTGIAVSGVSVNGIGVFGSSNAGNGVGVYGDATGTNAAGVYGENSSGAGVWGKSTGAGSAIYGQNTGNGLAGRFTGPVAVEGNLVVQGTLFKSAGSFRIDHPLDPANKFLSHSFVESPDMKNIYDGNVTTDASGTATVILPDYFAALNRDCRYQLTVLGQFAQAIVSRKIGGNSFEIRTDKPGVEVSWQVTGIRQDAYAQAHPIAVEEAKPTEDQGMYLFPAGFGAGEEKRIGHSSQPAAPETAQEIAK